MTVVKEETYNDIRSCCTFVAAFGVTSVRSNDSIRPEKIFVEKSVRVSTTTNVSIRYY